MLDFLLGDTWKINPALMSRVNKECTNPSKKEMHRNLMFSVLLESKGLCCFSCEQPSLQGREIPTPPVGLGLTDDSGHHSASLDPSLHFWPLASDAGGGGKV